MHRLAVVPPLARHEEIECDEAKHRALEFLPTVLLDESFHGGAPRLRGKGTFSPVPKVN